MSNKKHTKRVGPDPLVFKRVLKSLTAEIDDLVASGDTSPLPSEVKLADLNNCSRVTIRRVLASLESQGRIKRLAGKGTFPVIIKDNGIPASRPRILWYQGLDLSLREFPGYYTSEILELIHSTAEIESENVVLVSGLEDPLSGENPADFVKWTQKYRASAVILRPSAQLDIAKLNSFSQAGVPVVIWGRQAGCKLLDSVSVDYLGDMKQAIRLLVGLGHKRIAFVGMEGYDEPTKARWQAYREVLNEFDLPIISEPCHGAQYDIIHNDVLTLLKGPNRPTAIVTGGEYMDWPCLQALSVSGLKIPDDISFLATDDFEQAEHFCPPISVIRQPLASMVERAIQIARQRVLNPELEPQHELLSSEIIVRKSISQASS